MTTHRGGRVSPYYVHIVDELLGELRSAVDEVRAGRRGTGAPPKRP